MGVVAFAMPRITDMYGGEFSTFVVYVSAFGNLCQCLFEDAPLPEADSEEATPLSRVVELLKGIVWLCVLFPISWPDVLFPITKNPSHCESLVQFSGRFVVLNIKTVPP